MKDFISWYFILIFFLLLCIFVESIVTNYIKFQLNRTCFYSNSRNKQKTLKRYPNVKKSINFSEVVTYSTYNRQYLRCFQSACGYKSFSILTKIWKLPSHPPGKIEPEHYFNLTKGRVTTEMNTMNWYKAFVIVAL